MTADGAEWIWNLADDYFPDSAQIVDWFHACQHLADADQPTRATAWLHQHRAGLLLGNVHAITTPLDKALLTHHSRYFHRHQRRRQYQEFRENGFPIGSGTDESGIKQLKSRLAGPGMRWRRDAAQRMLVIRAAVLDHSFDERWLAIA